MAISFINFSTTTDGAGNKNGTTTLLAAAKPTDTAENDILIAHVFVSSQGVTITAPEGFTQILSTNLSGSWDERLVTYWKRATASEPASYSWSWSPESSVWAHVILAAYRGCVTTDSPIDGTPSANLNTYYSGYTTYPPLATGITTGSANSWVIATAAIGNSNTSTTPSGMTERVDHDGGWLNDVLQETAGTTGDKTWTVESSPVNLPADVNSGAWAAHLFALKAAGGPETLTPPTQTETVTIDDDSAGTQAQRITAGQYAYPTSDVERGNWTDQADGTTNIYTAIDEATTPVDTDYIRSGTTPSDDTYIAGLTNTLGTPESGTVTLRVRARWAS